MPFLPLETIDMTESVLRLLVLARFLCFVALVYLGLHIIFSRLISKGDSKILWFFTIVTGPLTRPLRTRLGPAGGESRLRSVSLAFYGALWIILFILAEILARPRP
jgi:hypothetical protein